MKAFVVKVNGKRLFAAGVGPQGILTAIVSWAGGGKYHSADGDLDLCVGGLDTRTQEHVSYKTPAIKVGDTMQIKIIETESFDSEAVRFPSRRPSKRRTVKRSVKKSKSRRTLD